MNIRQQYPAAWVQRLDDDILDMPTDSVCGGECAHVIGAAITFLEACPDLMTEAREAVERAARLQCVTLYFG
jgi:hypothetical protein